MSLPISKSSGHGPRGSNNERIDGRAKPSLIVDAVDTGLYGQVDPDCGVDHVESRYRENKPLWDDILLGNIRHGDTIELSEFQLLEWLPTCPGRFFTKDAEDVRKSAKETHWNEQAGEYRPFGKYQLVLGGVGSIRLAPRFIRGGEVAFFSATANGVSHEGLPVVMPLDACRAVHREIKKNGACTGGLIGTLWPLPLDHSPLEFDRGLPKYYLFAEQFELSDRPRIDSLVTIAITYSSGNEGQAETVGDMQINPSKNWSFASFEPSNEREELPQTIDWLKQYAVRHSVKYIGNKCVELPSEALSIVGDFDEVHKHFDNPIEFPLSSILKGQYDPAILDFYAKSFNITIKKETIMGGQYNISGGQQGAVGDGASAQHFSQAWSSVGNEISLTDLRRELAALREHAKSLAKTADNDASIGAIAKAEAAAANENGPLVMQHLADAGKWTFDVATKIGVSVAAAAMKTALGL